MPPRSNLNAPPEILSIIASFAAYDDQVNLSLVSRRCWIATRPLIWEAVKAVGLISLIIGRNLIDADDGEDVEIQSVRDSLPQSESEFSLTRFLIYAPYIKNLIMIDGAVLNEHIINVLLRQLQRTACPLLPNLRCLWMESTDTTMEHDSMLTGFGNFPGEVQCDVEALVILFLGPSVHTLGMHCKYLTISPDLITSRSPNIKDLRLGYAHEPCSADCTAEAHRKNPEYDPRTDILAPDIGVEVTPGAWPRACVVAAQHWHALSRLTVNGHFLSHINLEGLARLSALECLRLFGPYGPIEWDTLLNTEVMFPRLHELHLERTTSFEAAQIFDCISLMRSITYLSWLTHIRQRIGPGLNKNRWHMREHGRASASRPLARAIINLSRTGRLLERMRFSFDDDTTEEMRAALTSLPLQELQIDVQCWRGGCPRTDLILLAGAHRDLRSYTIDHMVVEWNHLVAIADAYPSLSSLSASIGQACIDPSSFDITAVNTRYEQAIELRFDFSFWLWLDADDDDVGVITGRMTRYLCELWPNHKLILASKDYRFDYEPRDVDRETYLHLLFARNYRSTRWPEA